MSKPNKQFFDDLKNFTLILVNFALIAQIIMDIETISVISNVVSK